MITSPRRWDADWHLPADGNRLDASARATLICRDMTIEQLVGQTILFRPDPEVIREILDVVRLGWAGGIVRGDRETFNAAEELRQFIEICNCLAPFPLYHCSQTSSGLGADAVRGGLTFPPLDLIPNEQRAFDRERHQGLDAARAGINFSGWVHADLATDIGIERLDGYSYRRPASETTKFAVAAMLGAQAAGTLTCGCHWLGYAHDRVENSLADLADDLATWKTLFNAGLDCIMVTSAFITDLDPQTPIPHSPECIRHLRDSGFDDGLIIADSFVQPEFGVAGESSIMSNVECAVKCLAAGCDLVLPPSGINPGPLVIELAEAVLDGRLDRQIVLAAGQRIVAHKIRHRVADTCTWEWTQRKQLDLDKLEGAAP